MNILAGAGNETTRRLIGWTGQLLGDHPDQRREFVADRSLVPNAIEELLRYESPSPVQARLVTNDVEHYGQTVTAGNVMLLLNASANRDERHFEDADSVRHPPATSTTTSRSATGCTSASVPRSPAWKGG